MVGVLLAGLTLTLASIAVVWAAVDAGYLGGVYGGGFGVVVGGLFIVGGLIA